MAVDPFDDFEFKPLTEGLGFHKKAEKIKADIKSSQLAKEKVSRSVPEAPPRSILKSQISEQIETETEVTTPTSRESTRSASQSISDLIASLPPSLDFLEDKDDPLKSMGAMGSLDADITPAATPLTGKSSSRDSLGLDSLSDFGNRPQIFQPLGRDDFSAPGATRASAVSPATPAPTISSASSTGPTVGSFLPAPGTKAGGASATSMGVPVVPTTPAKPAPSPYRERLDESFARAFPHAEKTKKESTEEAEELLAVSSNPVAAILDGMVAAGITTILLVAILAITRINLVGMLSNAQTDGPTQLNLVLLFLAVVQMYMLTARSFFGASLGEWAFDLQLGTSEEQRQTWYPVKVAWRMIIVTLTGLVVLPLISMIARRDLLKYLTGLQLYRRP